MLRPVHLYLTTTLLIASQQAFAQSANTTIAITIKNNTTSGIAQMTVPSCNGGITCNGYTGTIAAGKTGSESVTTTGTISGSYFQNFGTLSGTTEACNFQTFVDANFSGGCHTYSASASATAGPGGGHPNCQASVGPPPSGPSCSGGTILFTISP